MMTVQPSSTPPDPLIDDVRAVRRAIADQFDNDVDRLCEHLRQREGQHFQRLTKTAVECQAPEVRGSGE